MASPRWPSESGLDLVLLGAVVAGLGVYADAFADSTRATPSLVTRFLQIPPGTSPPAVLPQDRALLLMTDPRTADAATGGVASGSATGSSGAGLILVAVGVVLIASGVLLARSNSS